MFSLTKDVLNQLIEWTLSEKPNEAAGYLFKENALFRKIITGNHSRTHFYDDNLEKLAGWIKKHGKPTAIFHSHPGHAQPSYKDLKYMSVSIPIFECVWVIMSGNLKLRAWTIYGNYFKFPMRGEAISPREVRVKII